MVADKDKILHLLKTARGQIDAVIRMADDNEYCINISQQIIAVNAILNKANKQILSAHMKSCIENAGDDNERSAKIDEFIMLLDKYLK